MRLLGCCLAGILCRALQGEEANGFEAVLRDCLRRGGAGFSAMHRCPSRDVFPIRLGELDSLVNRLTMETFEGEHLNSLAEKHAADCWLLLSIAFCNSVHGYHCIPGGRWRKLELTAVSTMRASIERILRLDISLVRTPEEVEKELSSRFISYTGEEVPKMERLTMAQVEPALPPKGHGGSIDVTSWTKGATRSFLLHPSSCIQDDIGQKLPPLTAKVHIVAGEEKKLAQLLVARGICDWLPEEEVACYRNSRVLNGMFGVRKSSVTKCGLPALRVIMNFIPINSISVALSGKVQELPGVCQYMSITLGPNETILASQLDMTSAFYLFRMPASWKPYMCFALALSGGEIGLDPQKRYHLCCGVLPMGWSSAVAIMQEVSDSLLRIKSLSPEQQVTRLRPLPSWMTSILATTAGGTRAWYHVYLDNFFAGVRALEGLENDEDQVLQRKAEEAWLEAGVLSSSKKKVSGEPLVEELGALIDGVGGVIGGSPTRLLKLAQLTLLVVARKRVPAKWVQVVCGRWVHVLQFRRAGMVVLRWVWQWVAGSKINRATRDKSRLELFWLMCGSCLLHTNLRATVSPVASASDASGRGGAVGIARSLTQVGQDFVNAELSAEVPTHPALVVSLFNGVGGAFRTYDLCGVRPMGLVSVEISKPANRVVGRRWPQAVLLNDIRDITLDEVRKWQLRFPHVEEIHVWAGFPCVDLSRVRAGRQNLQGAQSGLFAEILRVQALLKRVFGQKFRLLFVIENVASMDTDALKELSQIFGVTPLYFQPSDAAPVSRPRVCWTNVSLQGLPGIILRKRANWIEVIAKAPHPLDEAWMTPGAERDPAGQGAIYPTCMKSIARSAPPPEPAGLRRASSDAVARWRADSFRYPPYQYKSEYVLWSEAGWRLLNSSERELLHGLGWQHTSLCWSASDIKKDEVGYEDQRCSLVGDGFSMYSFVLVTWALCYRTMAPTSYLHLCNRMGMAPGYCAPLDRECHLARKLVYGSCGRDPRTVADLSRLLLRRVNHTGSDIRVSSGAVLNPKAFPRQSVVADWWQWESVFHCRWGRQEHINRLELRSILLALKHRVVHLKEVDVRFLHLTDSYVCMSVVAKGRSSSVMLTSVLRQISAWYPSLAAVRGRKARAAARKGVVLRDVGITKATQDRYYSSVRKLYPLIANIASMEDLDETVADWIEVQFRKGSPINTVADGLSGLHYFLPFTRRKLPTAWKLFSIWRKVEVPSRAPPLTSDLVWAMTSRCIQQDQLSLGALLCLGFHCFLRTGELLAIRPMDLVIGVKTGVLRLPVSKGGSRNNIQESVTIEDPVVLLILKELLHVKRAQQLMRVPIWSASGSSFRIHFARLLTFFKVEHLQFRCYSLRRGGATAFFKATGSMERTLIRGRWQSIAVARLYLCDALAQLPDLTATPQTKKLVAHYRAFFQHP
eukprot:Skav208787  [mRNA]  locus=scaffold931:260209:264566:- [translate_table: standard]